MDSFTRPPATSHTIMPEDPTALSIDALCRAWRLSYLLLNKARCPDELAHAVELRRRYLDELAHRDPDGFRRWLDDGARAASDPSRYLGRQSDPSDRGEDEAA